MIQRTFFLGAALLLTACGGATVPPPPDPTPAASAAQSAAAPPPATAAAAANPAAKPIPVPPAIQAIIDAKDRSDADRALDAGRHAGELLAFIGVAPGWKVADLGA